MTERYSIYTGENLTEEMYMETWMLDNETFEDKDKLTKELALNWFYWSGKSAIVLWDNEKNKLVGYITPFLLNHKFACEYILSNKNYQKAIKQNSFVKPADDVDGDVYIFSTVISKEYRDVRLLGEKNNSFFHNKSAFKVLNEALVDWICDVKTKGVSINYVFAEKVTNDGGKYLESLGMQPCFALKNDCKYAKLFSPSMFAKCSNVGKLIAIYEDQSKCKRFDKTLLCGHEYL